MRWLTTSLPFLLALSAMAGESLPPLVPEGEHFQDVRKILEDSSRGIPRTIDFSPDGKTVAVGSSDGTVRLVGIASGREARVLQGHSARVNSVAFSPDGQTLASASDDNTVRIWQVASRDKLKTLQGHSSDVLSVAFSPDGQTLASASSDATVRRWEGA